MVTPFPGVNSSLVTAFLQRKLLNMEKAKRVSFDYMMT
jgi:hypothetical protein